MAVGVVVAINENRRNRQTFIEASRPQVFVAGGTSFLGRNLIPALVRAGYRVRSLALTIQQRQYLRSLGCCNVSYGEPCSFEAVLKAARGCIYAIHCACAFVHFDPSKQNLVEKSNNLITINIVKACQALHIMKLIVQTSEAVLYCGEPMINYDENQPYPENGIGSCAKSLRQVESIVLSANSYNLKTTVVRPRFLWGKGENVFMPSILKMVKTNRLRLVNGGNFLTSTCHVENACEGILCALKNSCGGDIYFLTDGTPVQLVDFLSDLLCAHGVKNVEQALCKSLPIWLAKHIAKVAEHVSASFGQPPCLTQSGVGLIGQEITLVDTKARTVLGYKGTKRMEDGFMEILHNTLTLRAAESERNNSNY